ncbi:MAG: helix-turn-helix domain-containing protein [Chromatiaceae bacterium]|nr:helix-turn-helix domain-containing protein [Chromatiaceae bacterium]
MTLLSVQQAATHVGVTRQTINRHIKQGKLSATIGRDGSQRIDTVELLRVYGELQPIPMSQPGRSSTKFEVDDEHVTALHKAEIAILKATIIARDEVLAMLRERVEELKSNYDRLFAIVERQSRLLPAPMAQAEGKPAKRKSKR